MSFIDFFWIGTSLGATHIITGTSITAGIRNFFERISPNFFGVLFGCPTCMGFWVGIILSLLFPLIQISEINSYFGWTAIYWLIFMHGCFSSFINWTWNLLVTYLDAITTKKELENELIIANPLEVAKELLTESANK
jgi:hypothetical protein